MLKAGDEFDVYLYGDHYSKKKVLNIEVLKVLNMNLKKIIFQDSTTWIEGIGSVTRGYIPSDGELICARGKASVLYLNSTYKDCDPIFTQNSWGIETGKEINIEVFPNPVNANSIIRLPSSSEKHSIEIFNYQGKLINSGVFFDEYAIGKLNLTKGFYILKIKTNNSSSGHISIIAN